MKKIIFILILLTGTSFCVYTQGLDFEYLYPKPTNQDLYDVYLTDNQHGWAVGKNGTCIRTTDGFNWEKLEIPVSKDLWSLHFVDNNTGWICGPDGNLLKTINGGDSWSIQNSNTKNTLARVFFITDSVGWVAGEKGTFLKTEDGGETWTPKNTNYNWTWKGIFFFNKTEGYIVGEGNTVKKTMDGGETWVRVNVGSTVGTNTYYDICFYNERFGYITAGGGTLIYTSDGGKSWNNYGVYSDLGGYSVSCPDSQKVYTVNGKEKIIYSANCGSDSNFEFQEIIGGTKPDLMSIHFNDTLNGWTVGKEGAIFYTVDGGKIWESSSKSSSWGNVFNLHFADNNHGWAATRSGLILETFDAGLTWEEHETGLNYLFAFEVIDNKHFWMGGPNDTIYYSNDNCKTWQRQTTDLIPDLWDTVDDIFMVDSLNGFAMSWLDHFLFTNDGGNNWTTKLREDVGLPGGTISNMYFFDKNTGWIVASDKKIYKTVNGGLNWIDASYNHGGVPFDICFIDSLNGWMCGWVGLAAKTTDGGSTWTKLTTNSSTSHFDIEFIDKNIGWAVGYNSLIYTFDGGETWSEDTINYGADFKSLYFLNQNTGWLTGEKGTIIRTKMCFANASDVIASGDSVLCLGDDSLRFSIKTRYKIYVGGESPDGPFGDYFYPNQLEIRSGDTIDFEWVGTKKYNLKFTDFENFNQPEKVGSPNTHQIVVFANSTILFNSELQDGNMTGEIVSKYKAAYDDLVLVNNNNEVEYFGKEPVLRGTSPEGMYSVYPVNHDGFYTLSPGDVFHKSAENSCFEIGPAKHILLETCIPYLSDLKVNESTVSGFNPDTLDYAILLANDTMAIPTVKGIPADENAIVTVTPATKLPGTSTITVTAKDGITKQVYTIKFNVERIVNSAIIQKNSFVKLYPNPATNRISIECQLFRVNDAQLKIHDVNGQLLLQKQLNTGATIQEVDIARLKSGVYFCHLISEKYSTTQKLIIQKY